MDDLTGLSWTSSTAGNAKQKPPPMSTSSYPYTLRPTPPLSGRSTPFAAPNGNPSANGLSRSNASTPANDSFANLVSFNAANPNKNLSLQEQQRKLQEERMKQQWNGAGTTFSRHDQDFWEKLGSGTSSPNPIVSPPKQTANGESAVPPMLHSINKPQAGIDTSKRQHQQPLSNGDDLFADLGGLPVDSASGVDNLKLNGKTNGTEELHKGQTLVLEGRNATVMDDDDPFGLGPMATRSHSPAPAAQETTDGDDDVLGLLGRPVSEFSPPPGSTPQAVTKPDTATPSPADRALAELVDMGFTPEKSRQALKCTESGTDVQAAVGWLLNQAHQESRSNSPGGVSYVRRQDGRQGRRSPPRKRSPAIDGTQPAWMKSTAERSLHQSRQSSRSPVNGEKDPSKIAAELGNNLFKTANSLWKTGTKKLNQAVAELNSDSDSGQPKWLRDPRADKDQPVRKTQSSQARIVNGHGTSAKPQRSIAKPDIEVTDEALMLESADARPPPRKPPRPRTEQGSDVPRARTASPHTQNFSDDIPRPRFMQQSKPQGREEPKPRLNKQAIEEQTAEAYISPARRKKGAPKPLAPEPDILFEASQLPSANAVPPAAQKPIPQKRPSKPPPTPRSPRPSVPARVTPPISPSGLQKSHTSRQSGTAAFKRGDYAQATTHYTSALSPLPLTHPLQIVLLSNRALSHLKTGDPKACIADTNTSLDLIGPSRGTGETIDLGDEGRKDMFAYWGKAMTRQAEALEQLEKWTQAGTAWKTCVEAGVGGATSIAGRNRCEKVVQGPAQSASKLTPTAKKHHPPPKPKPKLKVSALDDLTGTSTQITTASGDSEAVSRLRIANAALERLDDEKFALSDTVSDRVSRWRAGKENNLRALLASLDAVLWEGSGWKKVGMGELILPGKVKVVYMKGIARVHPDKLPQTATTEQKMISAAVFATLNEAWDGFKRENGL
ncbi:MAG: hypothetical protein LQ341_005783 [Variospora aurantia]|nr:MAG: hypothetical protein LQ341_005783 [Variospora aurantia]